MNDFKDYIPMVILGIVLMIIFRGEIFIPLLVLYFYYLYVVKRKQENPIIRTVNQPFMNNINNINIDKLKSKISHAGGLIVVAVLGIILIANMIVIVPAGETGVYHLFGKVRDKEISSGIHLINPLASVRLMSIRTEQYTMSIAPTEGHKFGDDSIEALTKEGLKVSLDMTVLFHLIEDKASDVYRELGLKYEENILRPEVRSAIREVIALYEAKDIYSEKRDEAVTKIEEILRLTLTPRGIEIESVLLRNVALPSLLTGAIEEKLTAEQEAQKYDFILLTEEKEAERKRIEAKGQRDAQQIINQGLTDRYLQYLYVQNIKDREGTIYVPYDLPLLRGI